MGTRGAELGDRIIEWLVVVMVLGGEGGGREGGGGRVIPIVGREGREGRWAGDGGIFSGIRRCGVDACVRKLFLLRSGMLSCIREVYGDSGEGRSVREGVGRPLGLVVM